MSQLLFLFMNSLGSSRDARPPARAQRLSIPHSYHSLDKVLMRSETLGDMSKNNTSYSLSSQKRRKNHLEGYLSTERSLQSFHLRDMIHLKRTLQTGKWYSMVRHSKR